MSIILSELSPGVDDVDVVVVNGGHLGVTTHVQATLALRRTPWLGLGIVFNTRRSPEVNILSAANKARTMLF